MKNKCKIGLELGSGRVKWVTCIKDGIATKLGKLLLKYYSSSTNINNLLQGGAVWSITEDPSNPDVAEVTRVKVDGMPLASEPAKIEANAHAYESSITLEANDIYECYYLFTKKGQWQITFRTRPNKKIKAKYTTENLASFLVALEKMFADRERAKEFKKRMKEKKRAEAEASSDQENVATKPQNDEVVTNAQEVKLAPSQNKLEALFMV